MVTAKDLTTDKGKTKFLRFDKVVLLRSDNFLFLNQLAALLIQNAWRRYCARAFIVRKLEVRCN